MSNNVIIESEDTTLAFTNNMRQQIVTDLVKGGIPKDVDNVKVLLTALKDMDSQAVNRKRLKVDEKATDNQAKAAALMAHILNNTNNISTNTMPNIGRSIPMLPSNIIDIEIVPGETDIDAEQQDYDSFVARMNNQ